MSLPATMRVAVYTRPGEIAIEERPVPTVADGDVLLEVSHCGICGSDIHFVLEGWGHPGSIEGHEFSGRVVAVGDAVTQWKVGDSVVGGPSPRCGECEFCLAGRPSLCLGRGAAGEGPGADGAFAEYIRVPERGLLRLPDDLGLREAALAEPLAVALHGLTRGDVRAGQRLLITGAGPIGALSAAAARMRGVTDIVVSEPHAGRRALVERLGIVAVDPSELTPPPSPNYIVDDPFDVALECSGAAAAMELALTQLRRAGTLVFVGAGMKSPRLDGNRILLNELTITGSFVYDEVFGWKELPTMTDDRHRLVLSCYTYEQFVFLISDDDPMTCPRLDHYGISVETEAELDEMLARAKAFQAHDERVDIVDKKVDDHGMLAITSFYVAYLLPMMVEVQWWEFKEDPAGAR